MAPIQSLPQEGLKLVVLLNAAAGAASHKGADGLRAELASALGALNVAAEILVCSGPELKLLAETALARARIGVRRPRPNAVTVAGQAIPSTASLRVRWKRTSPAFVEAPK